MGRRLAYTPSGKIRAALRQLWLRSRERAAALKANDYRCACCGVKQSRAKGKECSLDVHHIDGIEWEQIVELIRRHLLVCPDRLMPLCPKCHQKIHKTTE